jgi:hypothetical protein
MKALAIIFSAVVVVAAVCVAIAMLLGAGSNPPAAQLSDALASGRPTAPSIAAAAVMPTEQPPVTSSPAIAQKPSAPPTREYFYMDDGHQTYHAAGCTQISPSMLKAYDSYAVLKHYVPHECVTARASVPATSPAESPGHISFATENAHKPTYLGEVDPAGGSSGGTAHAGARSSAHGGPVHVDSYTRSNGTHVGSYTRSTPKRP